MRTAKSSRFLSAFLALAVVIGSIPVVFGMAASAESSVVNYEGIADQTALKINDYWSTLNMYDGAGLEVAGGRLITDKNWFEQLAYDDNDVATTGAYAIYGITPGTAFSATFTDSTNLKKMKLYFSDNLQDWFIAEPTVSGKTITVSSTPKYAKYAKIQWPASDSPYNGLISVSYTAAETDEAFKRVDYAVNPPEEESMLLNGKNNDSYLSEYGVWETSDNLWYYGSGIIQPDYSAVEGTDDNTPFDGYAVYKVQPGTHFGLTVTGDREASKFAEAFGKTALDWKVEIYGSLDGVNYRALNITPTYGARYSNDSDSEEAATRRSADYNFTVPDDVVFIKCKFPQTKDLSSVTEDGYVGADFFEINKVEFTQLKYDYCKLSESDYYIKDSMGGNIASSDLAKLGIEKVNGVFQRLDDNSARGLIDPEWRSKYDGKAAQVFYSVNPGDPVYFGFKQISGYSVPSSENSEGTSLYKYITKYKDTSGGEFALTITGLNDESGVWENIGKISITEDNKDVLFFTFALSGEENKYSQIGIYWPRKVAENCVGNDILGLAEAYFTAPRTAYITETRDFTNPAEGGTIDSAALKELVGQVGWSQEQVPTVFATGLQGNYGYLSERTEAGQCPYIIWAASEGQRITFDLYQNEAAIATYGNIKVYTSATIDFAEYTEYPITKLSDGSYICKLTVPTGHKYVNVTLPQNRRDTSGAAANDWFAVKSMKTETLPYITYNFLNNDISGDIDTVYDEYGAVNGLVHAVDWSTGHKPTLFATGIQGNWSQLSSSTDSIGKPYVTWEVTGGQNVSFDLYQNEETIPYYGGIEVYTSATLDFAAATKHELTKASDTYGSYICKLTVPDGHNYVKVILPQDRKYSDGSVANDFFRICSMTMDIPTKTKYNFATSAELGLIKYNDKIPAALNLADWSTTHYPFVESGCGITASWEYLNDKYSASEKAYVTWKIPAGRKVEFDLVQTEWMMDKYDQIRVYTASSYYYENPALNEHSLSKVSDGTYSCSFTVPEGEEYVHVVLPQNQRYNSEDWGVGNNAFSIKSMTVSEPTGSTVEEEEKTLTGVKVISETPACAFGGDIENAGILLELTYSDGETRKTDCGAEFSAFDSGKRESQSVTVTYKGFANQITVNVAAAEGDFNNDNAVDVRDLVRIKKIASEQSLAEGADPDLNGDDSVNASDIAIFRQHLIGLISAL